jgi:geranylgeranyl pyrophosphate synthase
MQINSVYLAVKKDLEKVNRQILSVNKADDPEHRALLEHAMSAGGKRVRPALTLMAGKCFDYNLDKLLMMASAVELMHTATLVHDDAIDKSNSRRGHDTVYHIWGEEKAVLLGDYLFARAGEMAADSGSLRAVRLFTQTLGIISTGEIMQSFAAFRLNQGEAEYLKRISYKTASLFVLSTQAGSLLCGAPEPAITTLGEYGRNTGIAFQIIDDILDFTSTEKEMGKPIGSDLLQGTLTKPAMLLLERYPGNNPVTKLFEQHESLSDEAKKPLVNEALSMVRNSAIIGECYQMAEEFSRRALENLTDIPRSQGKKTLTELAEFLIDRRT